MGDKGPGRPNEYGENTYAENRCVSVDPKLLAVFVKAWAERGVENFSRAMQAAMRTWLMVEGGKSASEIFSLGVGDGDRGKRKHVHVVLDPKLHAAIEVYGARSARTVPEVCKEALALLIRLRESLPEFADLDQWRFLPDPSEQPTLPAPKTGT